MKATRVCRLARLLAAGMQMCLAAVGVRGATRDTLSLAGYWQFALDRESIGEQKRWFQRDLPDCIKLPGTTSEARKGELNPPRENTRELSDPYAYSGAAWYQKEVEIPAGWGNKRVVLFLERTKPSRLWVDGMFVGTQNSLATGHVYDLTGVLSPGRHRLTICINNDSKRFAADLVPDIVEGGFQLLHHRWNGIVGRIELRATDRVWLDELRITPDPDRKTARVQIKIGSMASGAVSGKIELSALSQGSGSRHGVDALTVDFQNASAGALVEADYPLGGDARPWDEFSPSLYTLRVAMAATAAGEKFTDALAQSFGMSRLVARARQFSINGRTIFLRGKHDGGIFPLSEYPPMEVGEWIRLLQVAKSHGINHYRFHSHCPPEAAFAAADAVGIYLQPEMLCGLVKVGTKGFEYLRDEGKRILRDYGHHPSFVMFALGNEMGGDKEGRKALVAEFRKFDGRKLYAQGSNCNWDDPTLAEGDDYWTTMRTRPETAGNLRGSFGHADMPLGHIQTGPPATGHTYVGAMGNVPIPLIAHEVGQYQVYPDYTEIVKYKGVLKPWNLEVFRKRLDSAGMADQAAAFRKASGALAVINYREDIEAALRTPELAGFQLLDLQDFQSLGSAMVGILDAFMDSKGIVTPERWREFCAPTVVLALFDKYTWRSGEEFSAKVRVANYGPHGLGESAISWSLRRSDGPLITSGRLAPKAAPQGLLTEFGSVDLPVPRTTVPWKCELVLKLENSSIANRYDLWIYPEKVGLEAPANVAITRVLDEKTIQTLQSGGRVLLLPSPEKLGNSVQGFFASDFWSYDFFSHYCRLKIEDVKKKGIELKGLELKNMMPPGTLGILCDPRHPALADFPTESHSNYQWFQIVMNSRPVILDQGPADLRPIVQVIDNVSRAHRLGLVFEVRVGAGSILICSADLEKVAATDPAARQLMFSLLQYAGSERFRPATAIDANALAELLQL